MNVFLTRVLHRGHAISIIPRTAHLANIFWHCGQRMSVVISTSAGRASVTRIWRAECDWDVLTARFMASLSTGIHLTCLLSAQKSRALMSRELHSANYHLRAVSNQRWQILFGTTRTYMEPGNHAGGCQRSMDGIQQFCTLVRNSVRTGRCEF